MISESLFNILPTNTWRLLFKIRLRSQMSSKSQRDLSWGTVRDLSIISQDVCVNTTLIFCFNPYCTERMSFVRVLWWCQKLSRPFTTDPFQIVIPDLLDLSCRRFLICPYNFFRDLNTGHHSFRKKLDSLSFGGTFWLWSLYVRNRTRYKRLPVQVKGPISNIKTL